MCSMPRKKTCCKCGKPSISGLTLGNGLCQYHYNVHMWGQAWAEKVEKESRERSEDGLSNSATYK
jgi:hypothetical protein